MTVQDMWYGLGEHELQNPRERGDPSQRDLKQPHTHTQKKMGISGDSVGTMAESPT